jgi:predicted transglutaminase-like cysteine proteinase
MDKASPSRKKITLSYNKKMIKGKDYTKYGMNEDWNTKHSYRQSPVFVIARDECNLELV